MYAGYEPRRPLKRFGMSAAKEIVGVEESALHSRNMSEPSGIARSPQTTFTPIAGAEGAGAARRRLPRLPQDTPSKVPDRRRTVP